MTQYCVLCIEDDPSSLSILELALKPYERKFRPLFAKNVRDAYACLEEIRVERQELAMVIATESLNTSASQLLVDLEPHYPHCRKILTCDANQLESVITAVNEGRLDHCFTHPLQLENTTQIIKKELTEFIVNQPKIDWLPYGSVLDSQKIIRAHIDKRIHAYRSDFIRDYHSISDDELSEKVCNALEAFFAKSDESRAIRRYSPSHLLTKEGEPNQFLWFITKGEVALYKRDEHGKRREVVRHGKGGIIGGMSFVTGEKSFSTALTLSQTQVIKLSKTTFTEVMHSNSALLPLFTNLLLRHFNRRLQRSIHTKLQLQHTFESLEAAQTQLVENEKMVVLGQLVAGVAHELNNPIAAILRSSDTLIHEISQDTEEFEPTSKVLGKQVLERALRSNPISTVQLRQKSKAIASKMQTKQQAKMVVNMGLEEQIDSILAHQDIDKILAQLEHYYTAGTTLRSINVCSQRIADMVKSLKSYARSDEESTQKVDIHEGIEDTLVIFENRLKNITVERDYHSIAPTFCRPIALQQVWTNLISNALDAMDNNGKLSIHSALDADKQQIEIVFQDNGSGIESEQLENIFELNFTTKKQGDFGLGIGLSVCQQIVHQHQGSISVASTIGEGTQMIVRLPFIPQST
ncbi:ATP-binding protein [Vibrio breoganii]|uniref:histidine kinase n=2 Tax=Vibrio TaxID=662 RepID=A0AAP8SX35_9VIBR|nr:ATP-binding protein [Vibrio breoganii]OCH77272.1 ATPase [Vibrio breoganii]PMK30531.1 ATPase [Vibrio breoganii]PML23632.1 ATPase [Vibrio breoganii]PML41025.1 ATPase [Vibrio breoganii]PMM12637.1 ATPase [Vibrio breoganii]